MRALFLRIGIVAGVTVAGAAWLLIRGPLPLIIFTTVVDRPVPFWYSFSAFPILGMLVADLAILLWSVGLGLYSLELGVPIGLLVLLANLRLDIRIPLSGHVLLFSYFLVRRVLIGSPNNPIRHLELVLASVLFLAAAYTKVFIWSD